jgi:hypothetical protein
VQHKIMSRSSVSRWLHATNAPARLSIGRYCFLSDKLTSLLVVVFEGSDLLKAVLVRSTDNLVSILDSSPYSVHEKDSWGHSCLHLCVQWPQGLKLLIEHSAKPNVTTKDDNLPLTYACALNFLDSVKLLIANGSRIDEATLTACFGLGNGDIEDAVIDGLYHRREALRRLLGDRVPSMRVACDTVLDTKAHKIWSLLDEEGSPMSPDLCVQWRWSVYGVANLTIEIAEKLYSIGFRDISKSVLFKKSIWSTSWTQGAIEPTWSWKRRFRLLSWLLSRTDLEQFRSISNQKMNQFHRSTRLHLEGC